MSLSVLPFHLLLHLLLLYVSSSSGASPLHSEDLVPIRSVSVVKVLENNSSLVLASERTQRRDPLNGFKDYIGGWNISEKHYWASVSFTAVPLFIIAVIWFIGFGAILLFTCCFYCCCPRRIDSYSSTAYGISLALLILFTLSATVGCIVLYTGQGKFHTSTSNTLGFVVEQANITVQNLRNFSDDLSSAKKIEVDQVFLPAKILDRIDGIVTKVNKSANTLNDRVSDNSENIQYLLNTVGYILIFIAAAMLILSLTGFLLSICGLQFLVYLLVLGGWILVTGTFILCGVFLLLHNVVSDTCVSMNEWVLHPSAHTALDDILPCVDVATANESLYQSKEVTFSVINVVNQVVDNVANKNFPAGFQPLYYNQSGPLVPRLCNPFNQDLTARSCLNGEVNLDSATQVWQGYKCNAAAISGSEICTTAGRIMPTMYQQMTAAVNVSFGLYHYGAFLAQLEDCAFVRQTFSTISEKQCPGLANYSRLVYIGLALVSTAVMLSLVFWVVYARERQHRKYSKQARRQQSHGFLNI